MRQPGTIAQVSSGVLEACRNLAGSEISPLSMMSSSGSYIRITLNIRRHPPRPHRHRALDASISQAIFCGAI